MCKGTTLRKVFTSTYPTYSQSDKTLGFLGNSFSSVRAHLLTATYYQPRYPKPRYFPNQKLILDTFPNQQLVLNFSCSVILNYWPNRTSKYTNVEQSHLTSQQRNKQPFQKIQRIQKPYSLCPHPIIYSIHGIFPTFHLPSLKTSFSIYLSSCYRYCLCGKNYQCNSYGQHRHTISTQCASSMADRRRRIGAIICSLYEDDKTPMEHIIIATRNQWRCWGILQNQMAENSYSSSIASLIKNVYLKSNHG